MDTPTRTVDRPAPAVTRPGSLWGQPSRPAEARSTGFGTTVFDVAGAADTVGPRAAGGSVFDVCHAGVVLRALLFVHAVMAVGVAFNASGFRSWLALAAVGSSVALPAVLVWLLVACG